MKANKPRQPGSAPVTRDFQVTGSILTTKESTQNLRPLGILWSIFEYLCATIQAPSGFKCLVRAGSPNPEIRALPYISAHKCSDTLYSNSASPKVLLD